MPTLFKNGKNYSGTSVSLTQAEYDALTETQKNDGTVYFITDSDAILDASDVALGTGTVETLAGSIATIETSPATANHSVGEYIVYNGQLYKVTTAITSGTTLTGKISAVSVGDEIASLNSGSMQNRKLLGSGTPTANTSYSLNESVSNYKYIEIILVKNGGNGGAFVNKLVNIDNIGMGNIESLALSVYNTVSYHLHMECGFESATSFKIASYTCVGWTMSNVYIVGVSK